LKEGRVVQTFGVFHQVQYEAKGVKKTDMTVTVKNALLLAGDFEVWKDRKNQSLLLNGVNELHVSGHLTQDANVTKTETGNLTKARVAVNSGDETLYLDVTYWASFDLRKGQGLSITGRLLGDSYRKKDKTNVYTTYLEAANVFHLAKLNQ
jgi:Single-strand binding protein family